MSDKTKPIPPRTLRWLCEFVVVWLNMEAENTGGIAPIELADVEEVIAGRRNFSHPVTRRIQGGLATVDVPFAKERESKHERPVTMAQLIPRALVVVESGFDVEMEGGPS